MNKRIKELSTEETLKRHPYLTAHIIAESLERAIEKYDSMGTGVTWHKSDG